MASPTLRHVPFVNRRFFHKESRKGGRNRGRRRAMRTQESEPRRIRSHGSFSHFSPSASLCASALKSKPAVSPSGEFPNGGESARTTAPRRSHPPPPSSTPKAHLQSILSFLFILSKIPGTGRRAIKSRELQLSQSFAMRMPCPPHPYSVSTPGFPTLRSGAADLLLPDAHG